MKASKQGSHVLLTGATGFVGKVVLEELLSRRLELGIDRITLLIRPQTQRSGATLSPAERFKKLAQAELFSLLEPGWESRVDVVSAQLEQPRCGLSDCAWEALSQDVTQVIHCAASVDFDLPLKDATLANVTSALEMLELARACKRLDRMVDISTAYVTVWRGGPSQSGFRLCLVPRANLRPDSKQPRRSARAT